MEPGRQRLSQRRKAAALTQGVHVDRLAATPDASRYQLAELFTESKADATRAPSAPAEGTIRAPDIRPAVPPGRVQPEKLIRPRRWQRFPAAGVLAAVFAGGAASMLFVSPHSGTVSPDAAVTPALTAPVAAIPAPDLRSGYNNNPDTEDTIRVVQPLPAAQRDQPADDGIRPSATSASTAHDIRSNHPATIQRKPSAAKGTAPPGTRPTPAEVFDAWARAAGLNAGDQRWKQFRPQPSPHR